jgi:hypothetical protein
LPGLAEQGGGSHVEACTPSGLAILELFGAALASGFASAGQCPVSKQAADATKPVDYAAKGVTDTVLAAIELGQEPARTDGRKLRLRKLVIQPGGIVPWRSHGDRPAIIDMVQGEATEYG